MKPVDMVSSGENVSNPVASDKLQNRQSPVRGGHVLQQNPVSEDRELQSDKVDSTPAAEPKKEQIEKPDTIKLQSNQGSISPIAYQKVAATTEIVPAPQIVSEVTSPSIIREKVSEDGYHWRKYGQKLVKGNEFVRSYYRCTHPNCQAKKQLDCTHNGRITDTLYFGQHGHPKLPNLPLAVGFVVSVVEERAKDSPTSSSKDKSSNARGQTSQQIEPKQNAQLSAAASDDVKSPISQLNRMKDEGDNDDRPGPKRRKKDNHNNNATIVDNKPTGEARVVVQTFSEVDIVNDGYRWRKYGQKMVKGSPNPRNYYRCSSSGCPAKKHVERASHDSKLVITTYEGRHDHDMPPSRTVTHNIGMPTPNNCETGRKLEETDVVCRGTVHLSSSNHINSNEQLNGKLSTVPEIGLKDDQSLINSERKAIEQQNDEPSTRSQGTDADNDATSSHEGKPNNQRNSEVSTKPENKDTPCREMGETTLNQQEQTPKAEPVRS